MPRISSPRPLDLTKPFLTSSQEYGSYPFDLSEKLVTYYRDVQGEFVPDLSGRGNTSRRGITGRGIATSDSVPESGVSFFGTKSFDLTFNATSTNDVDCFLTVNDGGEASYSVDHKFTDGTRDLPFSISFWVRPSNVASTQYLITRAETSTNRSWEILIDSGVLRVTLVGTIARFIQSETSIAVMTSGTWQHVVVTYDGSESANGIKIYRNGLLQAMTTSSSVFPNAYLGMADVDYPTVVGSRKTSGGFSADDYRGLIYGIAIWKERSLSSDDVTILRRAYLNGSGGQELSGFISRSPRLHLRELDDLPGSYSTIRRTGDPTRTGTLISNFDDETSIVFSENGKPSFPSMLPRGSSFNSRAVDIPGQESDIDVTLPIRSFQHPTYLHYSPVESIGSFDENRTTPATDFFLSGTDPGVLPGFSSPVRSKIAIEIDITPNSDTRIMRNVDGRTVAEGQPSIGDKTGFLYYNFDRKEWEQIGLIDPATGDPLYYDYSLDTGSTTGSFPLQFTTTPGFPGNDLEFRNKHGYSKIGTPTSALGAPAKTMYHATSSQRLRMSDYISEPFLLEKVRVIFGEARAQRVQGDAPTAVPAARKGANRDIDNYVFFAYHQRHKGSERDTLIGISGSRRDLIFSGSMSFWNSASFYGSTQDEAVLTHTPAFDHNFGLSYSTGSQVGQFTGSIELEITPAISGRQRAGISLIPSSTINGIFDQWVGNFWAGGTSFLNFDPEVSNIVANVVFSDFFGWSKNPSIDRFSPNFNARSTRSVGGESQQADISGSVDGINTSGEQSAVSPYLLLPSDEIILGLEAGVSPFRFASTFSSITGSHFELAAKPCKVVFYGSLIKNFEEHLPTLNQDLSSNSIHEVIGNEPVLDQFMIEPASSYYDSYLNEVVTGSMANPGLGGIVFSIPDDNNTRRVVGRRIS